MQNVVYFNRWLIYSICVFEANNTYNLASSYYLNSQNFRI